MNDKLEFAEKLHRIMGYVQNDSYRKVTLDQDDATGDYILKVGSKTYYSDSLIGVVDAAYTGEGDPW